MRTVGLVYACVPYWGSKYAEGISDLQGRTSVDVTFAFERRRQQVLQRLGDKALALGADAIVGIRFDTREITPAWKELCAYGTAIALKEV